MNIANMMKIIKMGLDIRILKMLLKMYNVYKQDKNYSHIKGIKTLLKILEGEKITEHDGQYIVSTFLPPMPSNASFSHAFAVNDPQNAYTAQMNSDRCAPISVYIAVTEKCIFNCVHCSAKGRDTINEISKNDMSKLIKGLQDMGVAIIGFTGGEPLMRDDIVEIVGMVDDRSSSILFTSGYGLTYEKAVELKKAGLFGIGISFDSTDPEIHNKMRRSDKGYELAVKSLKIAAQAGLYTMSQTVIPRNRINKEELFKLFAAAKEYGANEVKILEPIKCGNLAEITAPDLFYTPQDRRKLIAIQMEANKISSFPKITSFAYTESKEKFGCGAGTQHSYISAAGDLYPCDFVPLSFGNIKDKDIADLWREMNKIIGLPKTECFAFVVNEEINKKGIKSIPLNKELSTDICKKCQSKQYPDFYKVMQG